MKKILVIDDDEGILDAFAAIFEESEYTAITASDNDILHTFARDELPDLILLDVLLSGKDGRDICRQLKGNEETKDIPVIMISAHPGAEKTVKEAGAQDFIEKPFDLDVLFTKIKKYLK